MQLVLKDDPRAQVCSWLKGCMSVFGETCKSQLIAIAPHHAVIETVDMLVWHVLCATLGDLF